VANADDTGDLLGIGDDPAGLAAGDRSLHCRLSGWVVETTLEI